MKKVVEYNLNLIEMRVYNMTGFYMYYLNYDVFCDGFISCKKISNILFCSNLNKRMAL